MTALRESDAFECDVEEKPDLYLQDRSGKSAASVYLDERYFVRGLYLDAWDSRMRGKKACCYGISRALSADLRGGSK